MKMDFFDANVFIGRPMKALPKPLRNSAELLAEMDRAGIEKALVWHIVAHDGTPEEGNELLGREISGQKRLCGCWTILPPQTGEVIGRGFFRQMKSNRIFALRAFPHLHRFMLNRVTFGKFLDEVSERKIPLLLSVETQRNVSWPEIHELLRDFPKLACIFCDVGDWSPNRYTWPLLDKYPNVCLETSGVSAVEGCLEDTVREFGAKRLVFGTALPEKYPDAAMLQLIHADIPDADKKKIASGNLKKIIERIEF
ncbi:MAG: amidohydrolase family protein [Kiritimatiellaeota bacterium]|nr:amidohydrolase family protein [Kiritimatiellota bacterium]